VSRGIEDVTMMYLNFRKNRCAFIQNSWLDPKKVRQMTVVGSRRMIVYDDTEPLEKLKIYDARVEVPPHYDSFAEFTYSYHYGDSYVPYIKQDEPLKLECQHFLECIRDGSTPITSGRHGLEVVRILEASGLSLKQQGAAVLLAVPMPGKNGVHTEADGKNGNGHSNGNGNDHSNGNGKGNTNDNGEMVVPARNVVAV
jgi:predicted dehydrogenase